MCFEEYVSAQFSYIHLTILLKTVIF